MDLGAIFIQTTTEANNFLGTDAVGITWEIKQGYFLWVRMFYIINVVGIGRSQVFLGQPVEWSIFHGCLTILRCCEVLDKCRFKCLVYKP